MKIAILIGAACVMMIAAGCSTAENPVSMADLHPTTPSRATYNPTNDCTTIEFDGGTMWMKGNNTNMTFYPVNVPMPIPPDRFESLYQFGRPQIAVATEYLGQKDGYAYLRIRSIPVDHPHKTTTKIVYVPLAELSEQFLKQLPAKGSLQP
jgi:hypothetical protein